jgi:hypothetical protein
MVVVSSPTVVAQDLLYYVQVLVTQEVGERLAISSF